MSDPRIPLKNRWLAGVLAFLVPGAGHFYQGRTFKAACYFVAITAMYLFGLVISGGLIIQPEISGLRGGNTVGVLKFAAQSGVGSVGAIGLLQRQRYLSLENTPTATIKTPYTSKFVGELSLMSASGMNKGHFEGTATFEEGQAQFGKATTTGKIKGTFNGDPIEMKFGRDLMFGPVIQASHGREVMSSVFRERDGDTPPVSGQILGYMPRSFVNWFAVPADESLVQDLHQHLGKYYEIATVFTLMAGLLNVLAIWDAVEGPAYGSGRREDDETPPDEPKSD